MSAGMRGRQLSCAARIEFFFRSAKSPVCYCLGKPWSGSLPAMARGGGAPNRSAVPQDKFYKRRGAL
jgi:hypothetical protein